MAADAQVNDRKTKSIFGVGRHSFEEFNFLQNAACSLGNGTHRVVGEMDGQAGFTGHQTVNTPYQ